MKKLNKHIKRGLIIVSALTIGLVGYSTIKVIVEPTHVTEERYEYYENLKLEKIESKKIKEKEEKELEYKELAGRKKEYTKREKNKINKISAKESKKQVKENKKSKESTEIEIVEKTTKPVKSEIKHKEKVKTDNNIYNEMKENIVGKSNKNIDEVKDFKKLNIGKVLGDKTGNWKLTKISKPVDFNEYVKSYFDKYINDNEVHFVVNFTNKTTTSIQKSGGRISVTVTEYVKKEELNAMTIGRGMELGSYIIYPDGDIEQI